MTHFLPHTRFKIILYLTMIGLLVPAPAWARRAKRHHRAMDVEKSPSAEASAEALAQIVARFPELPEEDDTMRNLNRKYSAYLTMIRPETAKEIVKMMRGRQREDAEHWAKEAARPHRVLKQPPLKRSRKGKPKQDARAMERWKRSQAAQTQREAKTQRISEWLNSTLPGWMSEVERAGQ